jgi:hypothetical protein
MTEAAKNRTWHKRLRLQLKREQHAKERRSLADIRVRMVELRTERRRAHSASRVLCRTERERIRAAVTHERESIKAERERLRRRALELRRRAAALRERAARLCKLRTARAKSLHAIALEALRQHKRMHQEVLASLRELDRRGRLLHKAGERRAESDDEVRANIPADLRPVFEKMKRIIRDKPGRSRTEGFLEWAEFNPEEIWVMRSATAEKELRALEREERTRARGLRKTRASLAALEAVPF